MMASRVGWLGGVGLALILLFRCSLAQYTAHVLGRCLISLSRLDLELPKNVWRKGYVGDDERARRHAVRGELLLDQPVELAHAGPFLAVRQPVGFRDYGAVGRDQHIGQLVVGNVRFLGLHPIDYTSSV